MASRLRYHPLGSGFFVGWEPVLPVDDPAFDVILELELEAEDGRLVVERFTAKRRPGGPAVTVDVLKAIPLVGLTSRAAAPGLLRGIVRSRPTKPGSSRVAPAKLEDLEELSEAERAAVVYRAAHFFGLPPTVTVAEVLGLSRDVAAKRVQAARLAGLLDPTTKGRKGA